MKMVKSLLLGSATGLIAVAGAQAADLPVKAKAVEYVKICSLYGVGYYYIPGTDTCIKIGGYVRFEAYHNAAGGAFPNFTPQGITTLSQAPFAMQARFRLTGDVRTQTEYGTLRSYFSFGVNALNNNAGAYEYTNPTAVVAIERAFVQFAGFTIGRSDTFFAFYNGALYGFVPTGLDASSGPAGLNVAAYTWQFGNGLSATFSVEDPGAHAANIINLGNAPGATNTATNTLGVMGASLGALPALGAAGANAGYKVPDLVANLRVDQAWGSAQIMGALHQVAGRYYTNAPFSNSGAGASVVANDSCNSAGANTVSCGSPDDKWGWAAGAGLTLKMPWDAKDTLSGVIAYSKGASRYVAFGSNNNQLYMSGTYAFGPFTDAVYGGVGSSSVVGSDLILTTAWGGTVAFEHYWTPALRTSWVFGYLNMEYDDAAKVQIANLARRCVAGTGTNLNQNAAGVRDCDPDWSMWRLSSRTMWNPVANLDVGIEVAYTKINTAFSGVVDLTNGNQNPNNTFLSRGGYTIGDNDIWSATVRVQRSFWP